MSDNEKCLNGRYCGCLQCKRLRGELLSYTFQKMRESSLTHDLAHYMNETGKRMMDRVCVCSHACRNHERVTAPTEKYPHAITFGKCQTEDCKCVVFEHDKSTELVK
jgi:hypothetical protein